MSTPEELSAEIERAIEVAQRLDSELLHRPGVVSVGPGVKRRKGKPTGQAAIVFTVREKLSLKKLKELGQAPFPKDIEGIAVDVVEFDQPVENKQTRVAMAQAAEIKDRVADSWLKERNVTGVGVGYKMKDGKFTDVIAVQVFVERKLPPVEVADQNLRLVPDEIDGVPTDVVQAGPFRETESPSGSRSDRKDPLVGGLSIGRASSPISYGTLAAIVFDNANRAMALSNEHVLDGSIGESVHQPSPVGLDDSLEVGFQLDVCNPSNFIRIDTPDTTGGSVLASAAVTSATAAALSDEIDPTREGQAATLPPPGARTREEYTKVKVKYPHFPLPGTLFKLDAEWNYERRTDAGNFQHSETPARQNEHFLLFHRLFTERRRYKQDETIRLFGALVTLPLHLNVCKSYHCVAFLRPVHLDKSYPVVLRPLDDSDTAHRALTILFLTLLENNELGLTPEEIKLIKAPRASCLYYGEYPVAGLPTGPWRHWMHVQTVNTAPPGTDPLLAAQVIGGLPASNHYKPTLDIACGPFVFEDDGSFDVELL